MIKIKWVLALLAEVDFAALFLYNLIILISEGASRDPETGGSEVKIVRSLLVDIPHKQRSSIKTPPPPQQQMCNDLCSS